MTTAAVPEVHHRRTASLLARQGERADLNVVSLALTALEHGGIDVEEVLSSLGECTFVVPDRQRMAAFDVLSELTSAPEEP